MSQSQSARLWAYLSRKLGVLPYAVTRRPRPAQYLPELGPSTARPVARRGAVLPDGSLVLMEARTLERRGLGRRSKVPAGSILLFSVIARAPRRVDLPALTATAAGAVARAIEAVASSVRAAAVQDHVHIDGRAVGRVLVEVAEGSDRVVIGVGVSVGIERLTCPAR